MRNLKKARGFTLIELMIVVAIIGILAAIAIPNFIKYQLRSKQAEAKTNIGGIKTNEEAFLGSVDIYAAVAEAPAGSFVPGVKSGWPVIPCPGCDRLNRGNCGISFECIGYRPAGDVYYSYQTATTNNNAQAPGSVPDYCVVARQDLDIDTVRGDLEMQTSNLPTSNVGVQGCGGTGCAAGLPPGDIIACDPAAF